jgi:hypothetical protein
VLIIFALLLWLSLRARGTLARYRMSILRSRLSPVRGRYTGLEEEEQRERLLEDGDDTEDDGDAYQHRTHWQFTRFARTTPQASRSAPEYGEDDEFDDSTEPWLRFHGGSDDDASLIDVRTFSGAAWARLDSHVGGTEATAQDAGQPSTTPPNDTAASSPTTDDEQRVTDTL